MKILSALWDLVKAVFIGKFLALNQGRRKFDIHSSQFQLQEAK